MLGRQLRRGLVAAVPTAARAAVVSLAALATACAGKLHLVSIDAPDLDLPIRAVTLQDQTPPAGGLGAAATGGLAEVLEAAEVVLTDPSGAAADHGGPAGGAARGPVYTVVLDRVAYDERVRAEPVAAGFEAVREGFVVTSWRVVDPAGAEVERLQDVGTADRWVSAAETREEALAGLPSAEQVSLDLARSAGAAYARRLVPVRSAVTRKLYGGGELRAGASALRADDVDRAVVAWRELLDRPLNPKIRARVHHDLAVAHELDGEYLRALVEAEAAAALDPAHARCLEELSRQRRLHRPLLQR